MEIKTSVIDVARKKHEVMDEPAIPSQTPNP